MQHLQLAQNISVLQTLNETPLPPSENSMLQYNTSYTNTHERVLSLKDERRLVEILTYWASTSSDPRKVIALCIEERLNGQSMIIRLAVNHGTLENVEAGLKSMKKILEQTATMDASPNQQFQDALRREIVSLNRNRIFGRLRSRHAKLEGVKRMRATKTGIIPRLFVLVNSLPSSCPKLSLETRRDLIRQVEAFKDQFSRLEELPEAQVSTEKAVNVLMSITRSAHHIASTFPLNVFLASIPRLDPSLIVALCNALTKLSHYFTFPIQLLRAAQRYPMFRTIVVKVVKFAPALKIASIQSMANDTPLVRRLRKLIELKSKENLTKKRKTTVAETQIKLYKDLLSQLETIDTSGYPVHAEIQLLTYYECYPAEIIPRLIVSSKKACYLCNTFFSCHGRFFIPASHGRIYEKWVLPAALSTLPIPHSIYMKTVMRKFTDTISKAVDLALQSSAKKVYQHPNESVVLASTVWSIISRLSGKNMRDESNSVLAVPVVPAMIGIHNPPLRTLLRSQSNLTLPRSQNSTQAIALGELSNGCIHVENEDDPLPRRSATTPMETNVPGMSHQQEVTERALTKEDLPKQGVFPTILLPTDRPRDSSIASTVIMIPPPFTPLEPDKPYTTLLRPSQPTVRVGTSNIHLVLDCEETESQKSQDSQLSSRHYVMVRILSKSEYIGPTETIIEIDHLREGEDLKIEGNRVLVARKGEIVLIEHGLSAHRSEALAMNSPESIR